MKPTCENCLFWKSGSSKYKPIDGQCRRRAPVKYFPATFDSDWCGEWENKDKKLIAELNKL